MKKIIFIIIVAIVIYFLKDIYFVFARANVSSDLIKDTTKFENLSSNEKSDLEKTILVIGDSTGYGVGSQDNKNSIPGRLYTFTNATYLENKSVSGAKIPDLNSQLQNLNLKSYDIILIQIGGNDITRFKSTQQAETEFKQVLSNLPEYKQLIVMSAGNVGSATIFPYYIRYFHTKLTLKYHAMFEKVISSIPNAIYVNLYDRPAVDPFVINPEMYLAKDGFHPSDSGYGIWFEKVSLKLNK